MRHTLFPALAALALTSCQQSEPTANKQAEAAAPATNAAGTPELPLNMLDRSQAGKAAPAATFLGPDGKPATLADFRGRPLLVNLWATWCLPCITEMPQLDMLPGRHKDLQVLTVSQDRGKEGKPKVDAFFAKHKFAHLKAYTDPEIALSDAFEVTSLPTTILYDSQGKEVWRLIGPEEWTGKNAAGLIGEALKKS